MYNILNIIYTTLCRETDQQLCLSSERSFMDKQYRLSAHTKKVQILSEMHNQT